MKLLIMGVGYLGRYILQIFTGECEKIWGTVRRDIGSCDSHMLLKFDEYVPLKACILEEITHILQTIPPIEGEDLFLKHHKQQLIQAKNLQWIGYCSTTGVYGDTQGGWVTEETPCFPTQQRSGERKHIEDQWLELWRSHGLPVHIFRISGIYGPQRSPIQNVLQEKARRIQKPGHVFSRIHVEDIVEVLKSSMKSPQAGEIYNLADDFPCSTNEIIDYICQKLNLPLPPEIPLDSPEVSDMVRSFYAGYRRASNRKIKSELGVSLKYPTYRQGLEVELDTLRKKS